MVDVVWIFLAVAFWDGGATYEAVTHKTEKFQTRELCLLKAWEVTEIAEKHKAENPRFRYAVECIPVEKK